MEKLYSNESYDGRCYPLDWWQDEANGNNGPIQIEEMKNDIGSGMMWCQAEGDFVEEGDGACGKHCSDYKPRNGKSGCCKSLKNTMIGTGVFLTVIPYENNNN